jgi:hypothetical protein
VLLRADRQLARRQGSLRVVRADEGEPAAGLLGRLPFYDDLPSAGWADA